MKACAHLSKTGRPILPGSRSDFVRTALSGARRVALAAAIALCPIAALACRCAGGIELGYQEAAHVVHARVTGAQKQPLSFSTDFEPLEVLKGEAPGSPLLVTGAPNFLCGLAFISVGRDYVFFVDESTSRDGNTQYVANCRSFAVHDEQTRADLVMLQRLAGPPVSTHPNSAQCKRLAQLEAMLKILRRDYTAEHPDVVQAQRLYDTVRISLTAQSSEQSLEDICRDRDE